jgi:glycosyltransferase involved in cell wall biosynthesis
MGGATRVYEFLQLFALRHIDAVIAVSRPIERTLRRAGVRSDKLWMIPNGCREVHGLRDRGEARRVLGLPQAAAVIGFVGRLIRAKGADVLLRAAVSLPEDTYVSIVGDGPERGRLEIEVERLGLTGRVRFHGEIPGAAELMSAFDVFALSSRTEGTPVTLLEAMWAGVPVVATAVGGVPDIVSPAEAVLVRREDALALASALHDTLQNPGQALIRARSARQRVEAEYGEEGWLERHEMVYRTVSTPSAGSAG